MAVVETRRCDRCERLEAAEITAKVARGVEVVAEQTYDLCSKCLALLVGKVTNHKDSMPKRKGSEDEGD